MAGATKPCGMRKRCWHFECDPLWRVWPVPNACEISIHQRLIFIIIFLTFHNLTCTVNRTGLSLMYDENNKIVLYKLMITGFRVVAHTYSFSPTFERFIQDYFPKTSAVIVARVKDFSTGSLFPTKFKVTYRHMYFIYMYTLYVFVGIIRRPSSRNL